MGKLTDQAVTAVTESAVDPGLAPDPVWKSDLRTEILAAAWAEQADAEQVKTATPAPF